MAKPQPGGRRLLICYCYYYVYYDCYYYHYNYYYMLSSSYVSSSFVSSSYHFHDYSMSSCALVSPRRGLAALSLSCDLSDYCLLCCLSLLHMCLILTILIIIDICILMNISCFIAVCMCFLIMFSCCIVVCVCFLLVFRPRGPGARAADPDGRPTARRVAGHARPRGPREYLFDSGRTTCLTPLV